MCNSASHSKPLTTIIVALKEILMMKKFLTAQWKNLVFANYEVDVAILKSHLPSGTEIDFWSDKCYVSLVGFMFLKTRVKGIAFPLHTNFEEFNLRFYVRIKDGGKWKRGVVFVKEIVPKRMITTIAGLLYGERYYCYPMRNVLTEDENKLKIEYGFLYKNEWNYIHATVDKEPKLVSEGSEEEFITEHYWGYTKLSGNKTSEYKVEHPKWDIHPVINFGVRCNVKDLYGKAFEEYLSVPPSSVFMAAGSDVIVYERKLLKF